MLSSNLSDIKFKHWSFVRSKKYKKITEYLNVFLKEKISQFGRKSVDSVLLSIFIITSWVFSFKQLWENIEISSFRENDIKLGSLTSLLKLVTDLDFQWEMCQPNCFEMRLTKWIHWVCQKWSSLIFYK